MFSKFDFGLKFAFKWTKLLFNNVKNPISLGFSDIRQNFYKLEIKIDGEIKICLNTVVIRTNFKLILKLFYTRFSLESYYTYKCKFCI